MDEGDREWTRRLKRTLVIHLRSVFFGDSHTASPVRSGMCEAKLAREIEKIKTTTTEERNRRTWKVSYRTDFNNLVAEMEEGRVLVCVCACGSHKIIAKLCGATRK